MARQESIKQIGMDEKKAKGKTVFFMITDGRRA